MKIMDGYNNENEKKTQAMFIEQEHRFIKVVINFFRRSQWEKNDIRRVAAQKALIWSIISPSKVTAIGGFTVGLISLMILYWQGKTLSEQNSIISEQNSFFQEQNKQISSQLLEEDKRFLFTRRTDLLKILFDNKEGIPSENAKLRAIALQEFLTLFPNEKDLLSGALMQYTELNNTDLSNRNLQNINFSSTVLKGTNFTNSNLKGASFNRALIDGAIFKDADLQNVQFANSVIDQSVFDGANFNRSSFMEAKINGSHFTNIIGFPESFKMADCVASNFSFQKSARLFFDEQTESSFNDQTEGSFNELTKGSYEVGDDYITNVLRQARTLYNTSLPEEIQKRLMFFSPIMFEDKPFVADYKDDPDDNTYSPDGVLQHCNSQHLNLCTSFESCSNVNGFWDGNKCNGFEYNWVKKSPLPSKGYKQPISFAIGSKGYIGTSPKGEFWEFDPLADSWTQKPDIPKDGFIFQSPSFVINDDAFLIIGTHLWQYNQKSEKWTRMTDIPGNDKRAGFGFSVGNKGYIGGGFYNGTSFWEYDSSTDNWIQKNDHPQLGYAGGADVGGISFTIGDKAYVTGTNMYFWEYNSKQDVWTKKQTVDAVYGQAFSIADKGYVYNTNGYLFEYDNKLDAWEQKPSLPGNPMSYPGGFSINGKGYIGGGNLFKGRAATRIELKDFWEYSPFIRKSSLPQ